MESIIEIQRNEVLATLDEASKALYLNPDNGEVLYAVFERARIAGNLYRPYAFAVGDTILGFHQTKDLPALLQQEVGVTPEVAQKIVADLAEFLAPVLEREAAAADPKGASLKALHQSFKRAPLVPTTEPLAADPNKPPIAVPSAAEPTPTTTPISAHNVTPMRTMAADMNRVHGYGAYRQGEAELAEANLIQSAPQDELLKDRPRLAGVPTVGD